MTDASLTISLINILGSLADEILFKNEPYRNDKMINILKKTLAFNEKFLETLENKKIDIEKRIEIIKKQQESNNG